MLFQGSPLAGDGSKPLLEPTALYGHSCETHEALRMQECEVSALQDSKLSASVISEVQRWTVRRIVTLP